MKKPEAKSRRRHPHEVSCSILEAAKTLSPSELTASFGIADRTARNYVARAKQQGKEVSPTPKPSSSSKPTPQAKQQVKDSPPPKPTPQAKQQDPQRFREPAPSIQQFFPEGLNPEQLANSTLVFVVNNDVVLRLLKNALQS